MDERGRNYLIAFVSILLILGVFVFLDFQLTGEVVGEWVQLEGGNSSYIQREDGTFLLHLYEEENLTFPLGVFSFTPAYYSSIVNGTVYGFEERYNITFNESYGLNNRSAFWDADVIAEGQVFYFQDSINDTTENIVGFEVLNWSYDEEGFNTYIEIFFQPDSLYENRWTEWINTMVPNENGDYTTLFFLDTFYETQVCPSGITMSICQTVDGVSWEETGQAVTCGGFTHSCLNRFNSEGCYDYEIKYGCGQGGGSYKPPLTSYCFANTCDLIEGDTIRLLRTNKTVRFENIKNNSAEIFVGGYPSETVSPGQNYTFGDLTIETIAKVSDGTFYDNGVLNVSGDLRETIVFDYSYDDPDVVRESFCNDDYCLLYEGQSLYINDTGHILEAGRIRSNWWTDAVLTFDGNNTMEVDSNTIFDYEDMELFINMIGVDPYGSKYSDYIIFTYTSDYGAGYWTPWFDDDTPSEGLGDIEYRWDIFRNHSDEMCERPVDIECRTVNGTDWRDVEGEDVQCSTGYGLFCDPEEMGPCSDYEVRFRCVPPLADGSYCQGGTCYLFEDDNVTISEEGELYVVHASTVFRGTNTGATFKFNNAVSLNVDLFESLTYDDLSLKVTDVLYPYSKDTKDLVIFDYVVRESVIPDDGGSSGSSGGGGGGTSSDDEEDSETLVSSCDETTCRIYNRQTLELGGHEIYAVINYAANNVYLEFDDFVEKFVARGSDIEYENLSIEITDYVSRGLMDDYVEFEYFVEDENYLNYCDGRICTIEENSRLMLNDIGEVVALAEIDARTSFAYVYFFHNGNERIIEAWENESRDEPYSFVFEDFVLKPMYVEYGTGPNGGDEFTFEFQDTSVQEIDSDVTTCVDNVCRIYAGDEVSVCGHTIEMEGVWITEIREMSRLFIDGFYRYSTMDQLSKDIENVTISTLYHYSPETLPGDYSNPDSYVEIRCTTRENKSYVDFCDYGEECRVNHSGYGDISLGIGNRVMLGDSDHIVAFKNSGGSSSDWRSDVYYRGESYFLTFNEDFSSSLQEIVMEDLTVRPIRVEVTEFGPYDVLETLVFEFEINDSYIFPEPEVSEDDLVSPDYFEDFVPTSVESSEEDCLRGCYVDGVCYDVSYRTGGDYCSSSYAWESQKEEYGVCTYNFECISNYCLDGFCRYRSVFHRVGSWFSWIFG